MANGTDEKKYGAERYRKQTAIYMLYLQHLRKWDIVCYEFIKKAGG